MEKRLAMLTNTIVNLALFVLWLRFAPRAVSLPRPNVRRQYARLYTGRRFVLAVRLQVVAVVV
jgi:hypothetical protein